jgi:glycosyltransferase involved in cell wall biosynthesis
VIHAHNPPDMLVVVALFYKLFGKRFVFDHHDLSPEMYYARFRGKGSPKVHRVLVILEKLSCRYADHVIATNQSYKKVEIERDAVPEAQITIVRNGPIIKRDEPEVAPAEIDSEGKLLIAYMGVIGFQDGVDNLLNALCHLRAGLGRSDFLCLIMGDGDALPELKALAAELRLDDCVRFLGWIQFKQVAGYLKAVDICAAPEPKNEYNDRSTVIKITEYMAASKPIVAFDLTEHRVTADEAALYATPNDPCDFACKLNELMNDPERRERMGRFGRQRIEQKLSWSQQAENLLGAYAKLAAARSR